MRHLQWLDQEAAASEGVSVPRQPMHELDVERALDPAALELGIP